MFEVCGLEIFKVTENDVNGGSYGLFARKLAEGSIDYPEQTSYADLMGFKDRIDSVRSDLIAFIDEERARGKSFHVYGASTKGNVILQYFGLDRERIDFASERSPEKWGRFTVGSWIPIISEERSQLRPDYYIVLPWAFFSEMYKREKSWRDSGGRFIVPFPEFRVVD